jgi:hypothetical protein
MRVNARRVFWPVLWCLTALFSLARADDSVRSALEQEYQKSANPELLYKLGALHAAQGQGADAMDFLRRYLADPQIATDGDTARSAQKLLAGLRATTGELFVIGDKGATLSVDGRLRGILPLTMPLLLAVGEHAVALRSGSKVLTGQVKIEHGRRTDMRFELGSRAVVVSNPPPVVVLSQLEAVPPEVLRKLSYTIDRSVTRAGLAPFLTEVALARVGAACSGTPTLSCQEQLAQKSKLDYVLTLNLAAVPPAGSGQWQVTVRLFDAQVGDVAASGERALPIGTPKGLSELAELIDQAVTSGASRTRGTLNITSEPPGAEVVTQGRALGVTPLSRAGWPGPMEVTLRLRGYLPQRREVTLLDQKTTSIEVTLVKEPVAEPPPKRPPWRLAVGAGTALLGLGMIGFGGAALGISGTCTEPPMEPLLVCPRLFDTVVLGGALVGVGSGLVLAGVALFAWPPRRSAKR